FFFFSSRRRHTRFSRDWSSDVCSSDLNNAFLLAASIFPYFYALVGERNPKQPPKPGPRSEYSQLACDAFELIRRAGPISKQKMRSEERRVGKECRGGWGADEYNKKGK